MVTGMPVGLRYLTFAAVLVIAFASVLVCGEAMCESGTHGCVGRVSRFETPRRLLSRLIARVHSVLSLRLAPLMASFAGSRWLSAVPVPSPFSAVSLLI